MRASGVVSSGGGNLTAPHVDNGSAGRVPTVGSAAGWCRGRRRCWSGRRKKRSSVIATTGVVEQWW